MDSNIAKQEIATKNEVIAYEALYRGEDSSFPNDVKTKITLDSILYTIGIDNVSSLPIFVNFEAGTLLENFIQFANPDRFGIEILESSRGLLPEIVEYIKMAHNKGFIIALDDFKMKHLFDKNVFKYVHIIKVDFRDTDDNEINKILSWKEEFPHLVFLAEKIETKQEYDKAVNLGFEYFQGNWINEPETVLF